MTTPTTTPWWRHVLTAEPVAVQAAIRAALVLAGAILAGTSLAIPDNVEPWLLGIVAAFYLTVEAITTLLARARATPDTRVVQAVDSGGRIVAGPASPTPTGTEITTHVQDHPTPTGHTLDVIHDGQTIARHTVTDPDATTPET